MRASTISAAFVGLSTIAAAYPSSPSFTFSGNVDTKGGSLSNGNDNTDGVVQNNGNNDNGKVRSRVSGEDSDEDSDDFYDDDFDKRSAPAKRFAHAKRSAHAKRFQGVASDVKFDDVNTNGGSLALGNSNGGGIQNNGNDDGNTVIINVFGPDNFSYQYEVGSSWTGDSILGSYNWVSYEIPSGYQCDFQYSEGYFWGISGSSSFKNAKSFKQVRCY